MVCIGNGRKDGGKATEGKHVEDRERGNGGGKQ